VIVKLFKDAQKALFNVKMDLACFINHIVLLSNAQFIYLINVLMVFVLKVKTSAIIHKMDVLTINHLNVLMVLV
jgi:hypothetical protein